MKKNYLVPVLILLAGCASSTGVVKYGEDTYMVSGTKKVPNYASGSEVKVSILSEANDYCNNMGKKVKLVNSQQKDQGFFESASAEIQFKCLNANDPELKQDAVSSNEVKQTTFSKTSATDKLKELDSMHQQGLISDSEYASKKKAILDSM